MTERSGADLSLEVTRLAERGRLAEALAVLDAAVSGASLPRLLRLLGVRHAPCPERARVFILRGDVLVRLRRGEEAGASYDRAVDEAERGMRRAADQSEAEAEHAFQRLAAVAHMQRAANLCARGERVPALGSVEAALRLLAGPVLDPVLRAEGCHLRAMLLSHAVFRFTLLLDRTRAHLARLGRALEVSVQSFRGSGMMARALASAVEGIGLMEAAVERSQAGHETWVDGCRASRRELQERLLEQLYVGLRIALALGETGRAARWLERGLHLADGDPATTRAFLRLGLSAAVAPGDGFAGEAAIRSAASLPAASMPQWRLRVS